MQRIIWLAFWAGMLVSSGLNVTYQDYVGKEAYLHVVATRWIDLHWTVGFSVVLFGLVMLASLLALFKRT